jgi:uncharacterized membrane protein
VPFVFGLVPIFDLLISFLTGKSLLTSVQFAGVCLLVPGALILAYRPGKYLHKYLGLTALSALLYSCYNFLWQYGSQQDTTLNSLMWNRLGAAAVLIIILIIPQVKKQVFASDHIEKKIHTGFLFLFKQALGGLNFIFLSLFLSHGKVPIVDGLAGFRYAFLFLAALFLSYNHKHILDEEVGKKVIWQKLAGLGLIFTGTIILFAT